MTDPDFVRDTRSGYDAIADGYAETLGNVLAGQPVDRALLAAFAELVREAGDGPVVEVGSGPGAVTAYLHGLGLDVRGIDLSPRMVEIARRDHPDLPFTVGSMLALDVADGSLGGLVANYSIIHVPDEHLPTVFSEFHRALAPGGYVFVAFQVGDEPNHHTEGFGQQISLTFHRRQPDDVAELMDRAGLTVSTRAVRTPEPGRAYEKTPQAYLIGRRHPDAT